MYVHSSIKCVLFSIKDRKEMYVHSSIKCVLFSIKDRNDSILFYFMISDDIVNDNCAKNNYYEILKLNF